MEYNFIATWKMALEAVKIANVMLRDKNAIENVIECAISNVENNPKYTSVGYGGLPNALGEVELDASYMNGSNMGFGAIGGVKNIKNPIKVAINLSKAKRNIFLVGDGAEKYARENNYEFRDMLTEYSKNKWKEKISTEFDKEKIEAYGGHDTVCMIGKDENNDMAVGVSTSGLFMKHKGRLGDSPVIGSGLYCISKVGGAAATGVGEDIMKGCLSYEIVSKMNLGKTAMEACKETLKNYIDMMNKLGNELGSISLIALDNKGNFGAATNKKAFPFVVSERNGSVKLLVAEYKNGENIIFEPNDDWIKNYTGD